MKQNSVHEEFKGRPKSGKPCYHSVQNFLSSNLLSKNIKTKIYKTIILPPPLLCVCVCVCVVVKLGLSH